MTYNTYNNQNYDYDSGWKTFAKILYFCALILTIVIGVTIGKGCGSENNSHLLTKRSLSECKGTVLTKAISELPKGPYLYRIFDKTTNTVHFVNAAGGGITSFKLDDIEPLMDEAQKNAFFSPVKKAYNYGSIYQNKSYMTKKPHVYWQETEGRKRPDHTTQ